ncbi:hypothetical protein [Haliangium sp. UPWRP_2]|uniref:hypothetical protein n=1 Tax=Haliangium sp. UPWRP_2 TaxID=1931276 RepID=UPI0018ED03D0|nr:hypothetical protein [Haliangium sp. UPWRP_2]
MDEKVIVNSVAADVVGEVLARRHRAAHDSRLANSGGPRKNDGSPGEKSRGRIGEAKLSDGLRSIKDLGNVEPVSVVERNPRNVALPVVGAMPARRVAALKSRYINETY